MFPVGKQTVEVSPFALAFSGGGITSSGSRRLLAAGTWRKRPAFGRLPPVGFSPHRLAGDGHGVQMQQAKIAQIGHHLRHRPREEGARTVG